MFTRVHRIDLTGATDLAGAIADLSDNMLAGGFRLVATFAFETQLVLIYQRQA